MELYKQSDYEWLLYDRKTEKGCSIIKCAEYFMGKTRFFYRIDVAGKTKATLIRNFQSARKIAQNIINNQ